jgi:hypothetical protein
VFIVRKKRILFPGLAGNFARVQGSRFRFTGPCWSVVLNLRLFDDKSHRVLSGRTHHERTARVDFGFAVSVWVHIKDFLKGYDFTWANIKTLFFWFVGGG